MERDGKQSLWLRYVETGSDTQVVPPAEEPYASVRFSPDGNYIYFRRAADQTNTSFNLMRTPVLGGRPHLLVRDVDADVAFSPDGRQIAYARGNAPVAGRFQLLVANMDGTGETAVDEGPIVQGPTALAWSPDGKQVLLNVSTGGESVGLIQVADVGSWKRSDLARLSEFTMSDMEWLQSGRGVVLTYEVGDSPPPLRLQIWMLSMADRQFHKITRDTNGYATISVSKDEKSLASVQQKTTSTLYVMPPGGFSGSPPEPAGAQQKDTYFFSWASNSEVYFDGNLQRVTLDGSGRTTLSTDPNGHIFRPMRCAGDTYIAF